jgi:chloramphenicol-sensitive protein RarD
MSSSAAVPAEPIRSADAERRRRASGMFAALACFTAWGLLPAYWKQIPQVAADEMVTHRLLWSLLFVGLLLSARGAWGDIRRQWSMRTLRWAAFSGAAMTVNWWLFIWAVNTGRVIDTSLGYFLMPLFNLVVGLTFFRERLRLPQWVAVGIAAAGVSLAFLANAGLPWVSLALCGSFGLYGALRKQSHLDSLPGLFFETLTMAPLALGWLIWKVRTDDAVFGPQHVPASLLLVGAGVVTAVPLLWFSHAARRLPLSTVGFLQYLSPSLSFVLGVAAYHERVTSSRLTCFVLVWAALAVFTADALWQRRRARPGLFNRTTDEHE